MLQEKYERGHSKSTYALEGREGVPEKRTAAYKGGGGISKNVRTPMYFLSAVYLKKI